jgi:hypothetical protein
MSDPGSDRPGEAGSDDPPPGWRTAPAAVYGLEQPVRCPGCGEEIDQLYVVRLYRAKVNFMSSLPRSGRLLVCPKCRAVVPGELGAVL